MTAPLRVLCLDIEGGYGGSSRSLYFMLKHVDRSRIAPTVWCRRDGPIRPLYEAIGIPVEIAAGLPKASALPRLSRNLWQAGQHARDFVAARARSLPKLAEAARGHDLVHFNHEAFALLAAWLRKRAPRPATMHIRTNVVPSAFSRFQMRMISRSVDAAVFITPNEERTFRSLGGDIPGRVIFNVVEPGCVAAPHPAIPRDGRLVVASLSNAAVTRGTDRLIDIAKALKTAHEKGIVFAMAGEMRLNGSWPGPLGAIAAKGGTLEDAARELGLADYFLFLGHVDEPERVLAASDLLIKPTRDANPWGRDILEAMAAGKPVVSIGTDCTFVETGQTGLLLADFDADATARQLAVLRDDRVLLTRLGRNAGDRVSRLCNGSDRAAELCELWSAIVARAA